MPSLKGITSTIFSVIAEAPFVVTTAFSRKSFYEKSVMLEFGFKPWQVNQTLKRLELGCYFVNKKDRFYLTKKGLAKVNYCKLEKIKLTSKTKWDGKWRLIIFDIPETVREARDALRNKLKEWGCYKIQNSVFVFPFVCEKEISEMCTVLKAHSWIHVFLLNDLGAIERKARKHYQL